ncbi:MAG TPA: thioredoxin family protein [Saprospiraceae bacterium]|jgi:peroxiredoxin|nr:thioredoxin family protein [Saprospiraceae bacterium]
MKIVSFFLFLVFNSASIFAGLNPGDKASDFSLVNVNGKKVSLSDYKDAKGFIIVFTCNHCPYAKMYEQRIIDLHNKYAGQGYPIIAINPNDPNEVPEDGMKQMKKLAKKKKYPFPYLLDEGQKVYPAYGATKTPHVYVLDKHKTVHYIGAIDDNAKDATKVNQKYLELAIEEMKAGKDVTVKTTKAIGCSIKTKSKT